MCARLQVRFGRAPGIVVPPGLLREAIGGHLLGPLAALDDPAPTRDKLAREHKATMAEVDAGRAERAANLVQAHISGFYAGARSSGG